MAGTISQKPMNLSEAAAYTGLSKTYLYKLIHLKKIPCYKPTGGRVFFKREELDQFIFRGKQSADYELNMLAEQILTGGGYR
ncbi:helix-turn-helix domain-containing protein [Treponema primitia]|uniref:helix-turn-helix transcriptional regulator n=1 Tax=Treponema primitia TaxID=88058 RepID=UPI00397EAFA8